MKRRNFVLTAGSAILSGATLSGFQNPSFGLEFEISSQPNREPSNIDSILVSFSKFKLTPRYVDSRKDVKINIEVKIGSGYSESISKTVSITNGNPVILDDIKSELPLLLDGINTSKKSLKGDIVITINHDSIGSKSYNQSFRITDNPLLNGLVAYYPMEKGHGNVLHDASENNIGQIINATWNGSGKVGANALKFDGNGYVDISNFKSLENDEWTFSFWIFDNSSTSDIRRWLGTTIEEFTNTTFNIRENGGSLQVRVNGSTKTSSVHQKGTWQHYVVTSNGSSATAYRNATEELNFSSTGIPEDGLFIGGFYTNNGDNEYTDGVIDDVRVYNRSLSETEIESLYNATKSLGRSITESDVPSNSDGGISRYRFDGNVADSWGSNDGTNNANTGYVSGAYKKAKNFDGSNDIVTVDHDNNLDIEVFTVSAWIYWNKPSKDYHTVIDKRVDGTNATGVNYQMFINQSQKTDKLRFTTGNGSKFHNLFSNVTIPSNTWIHATIVRRSNSDKEIYFNATPVGSDNDGFSSLSNGQNIAIGDIIDKDHKWNGYIDDVRIYNQALTQTEIEQIFKLGSYQIK